MVFDAVSLHQGGKLSMESFRKAIAQDAPGAAPAPGAAEGAQEALLGFAQRLPSIEQAVRQLVAEAMRRANGNQTIAAGLLGISRPALSKRLKKNAG